jgi:tetratricopeptide (TPR) repeat protein
MRNQVVKNQVVRNQVVKNQVVFVLLILIAQTQILFAQDQKQDKAPPMIQDNGQQQTSKRNSGLGENRPSVNSAEMLRREREQNLDDKSDAVIQKLQDLISRTADTDRKKPVYLDRLAKMYWDKAGLAQSRGYEEADRCIDKEGTTEEAVQKCDALRAQIEAQGHEARDRAIEVYKYILQTFPDYESIDEILFALGFNFQQQQQNEAAQQLYTELIQRFNSSPKIPDALFNMAEVTFNMGKIDDALQFYSHVVDSYKDSPIYVHAVYKIGWCYFNKNDYANALNQFVAVIEYSDQMSAKDKQKNRISIKKEALKDMVRTYAHIEDANPTKAVDLFKRYAPDNFLDMSEKLADAYTEMSQFEKSSALLEKLIKLSPNTYKVVGYQRRISENIANNNQPGEAVLALKRLVTLFNKAKTSPDADPKRVQEDYVGIERQLKVLAVRYHNQALETKSTKDFSTALELYEEYVNAFPEEEGIYGMYFYYAELLYRLEKWSEAATAYEKVLKINSEGEHTKDSAHGAVLSFKNMLKSSLDQAANDQMSLGANQKKEEDVTQDTSKKKKKKKKDAVAEETEKKKEVFAPKEIPTDYKRYLDASALYRKYVQESEYLTDITFEEARVYFIFHHLDSAIPLFKEISEKNPQHRIAVYAANLLLEAYNMKGDFDSIAAQVDIFLGLYSPSKDKEFVDRLNKLKGELDFQKCSSLDTREEHVKAAQCFLTYADRFKGTDLAAQALYNAALNYDKEKQMEKAIKVRNRLINELDNSNELVPKTLFKIAQNLQGLAVYSQASKAYEFYAQNFPDRTESVEALRIASQFRKGLGELDLALNNLNAYIKKLGKSDEKKAVAAYFAIGEIYKDQQKWGNVISHYQSFTKRFGNVDTGYVIRAFTELGNAYQSQPKADIKKAQEAYRTSVMLYSKLSDAQKSEMNYETAYAAAEARFKMADYEFSEIKKKEFVIKNKANVQTYIQSMADNIKELDSTITKIKAGFEEVLALNVQNWGLASLARIGEMYEYAFLKIEQFPPPVAFDFDTQEMFKSNMIQKASPIREKAVESYNVCLKKALELQWFNEWTDLAEKRIAKISPENYHYSSEIRSQPNHFYQKPLGQKIMLPNPEDEEN